MTLSPDWTETALAALMETNTEPLWEQVIRSAKSGPAAPWKNMTTIALYWGGILHCSCGVFRTRDWCVHMSGLARRGRLPPLDVYFNPDDTVHPVWVPFLGKNTESGNFGYDVVWMQVYLNYAPSPNQDMFEVLLMNPARVVVVGLATRRDGIPHMSSLVQMYLLSHKKNIPSCLGERHSGHKEWVTQTTGQWIGTETEITIPGEPEPETIVDLACRMTNNLCVACMKQKQGDDGADNAGTPA